MYEGQAGDRAALRGIPLVGAAAVRVPPSCCGACEGKLVALGDGASEEAPRGREKRAEAI